MDLKVKKILVTGGAGFIGSTLVKKLHREGADVYALDNLIRGNKKNLLFDGFDINTKLIIGDLSDYKVCLDNIKGFDYVYHLADLVGGIHYVFNNESYIFRQNMVINTNTLYACIENKIPNYIYIGTACSFPEHLQNSYESSYVQEDQTYPANPESSYGWSKLMGEYEAELAHKNNLINVGVIRSHNVYGPGATYDDKTSQVIPSLIKKAVLYPEKEFIVWGSGQQYRDFIYIDDLIESFIKVIDKGMGKGVIQVGSGVGTSIKELSNIINEISGKNIDINFDTTSFEGDKGRIGVIEKAKNIIDWAPSTPLKEGLIKTYKWINEEVKK